mgnify:FL=1|jgi:tRNA (cmo5U34)-methyltransferase
MNQNELKALFDQQASSYDIQWEKTAPIRHCLHLLLDSMFSGLPVDAKILCVGLGTGAELSHLAQKNPLWRFTAVEPSGAMLDLCKQKAEQEGFASRCVFHQGYLETLPKHELHDAATCFLVSQFFVDQQQRSAFFLQIANRLKVRALLASSDLASDTQSAEYDVLLRAWMNMMSTAAITAEAIDRMRAAYSNDVGVLAPDRIASIIAAGGFERPVQFFQAGLIHAWLSRRAD